MTIKFPELDLIKSSSFQPLQEFKEDSSKLKPMTNVYSDILLVFINKPRQDVIKNLTQYEPIQTEVSTNNAIQISY